MHAATNSFNSGPEVQQLERPGEEEAAAAAARLKEEKRRENGEDEGKEERVKLDEELTDDEDEWDG